MKTADPPCVLLVDDRIENLVLLESMIQSLGLPCLRAFSGMEALKAASEQDFAVVLLDVQMPGMDGFETAERLKLTERNAHTPVIFITAEKMDDTWFKKGFEHGAVDYMRKPIDPDVLKAKVHAFFQLAKEHRRLEAKEEELEQVIQTRTHELRESEAQYRSLMENAADYVVRFGVDSKISFANRAFLAFLGKSENDFLDRSPRELGLAPDICELLEKTIESVVLNGSVETISFGIESPTGHKHLEFKFSPEHRPPGVTESAIAFGRDISQRLELEQKVQQTLHLESLASLAGGIAHDMNNALAAILGMASALTVTHEKDRVVQKAVNTITQASLKGRDLVKNLNEFARQGLTGSGPLNLNDLIRKLAQKDFPPHIQVKLDLDPTLKCMQGEPYAMKNAMERLLSNAVLAMPQGGILEVRTRNLDNGQVEIQIIDHGEGMTQEVKNKVLEPFFTTRPFGEGKGLGLPVAYGTVKAHGGSMAIQSKVGEGTAVLLRFPSMT